jgi:hypothetical protein
LARAVAQPANPPHYFGSSRRHHQIPASQRALVRAAAAQRQRGKANGGNVFTAHLIQLYDPYGNQLTTRSLATSSRGDRMSDHNEKAANISRAVFGTGNPIGHAGPISRRRMRERQSSKIRELREALIRSGFCTLERQAMALGLPRSTTWTIVRGTHKASGLSATVINRMLSFDGLPSLARATILRYIDEKMAGLYGDGNVQLRRFASRLSATSLPASRPKAS